MKTLERKLAITIDVDGTLLKSKAAEFITLAAGILRKDEGTLAANRFPRLSKLQGVYHRHQTLESEALTGLHLLEETAANHKIGVSCILLSDRGSHLSEATQDSLMKHGIAGFFDAVMLNSGLRSRNWKASFIIKLLDSGCNVVHIDDDMRRAIQIAELNGINGKTVFSYVKRNISTNKAILRLSGIDSTEMPNNLVFVNGLEEMARHLISSLESGELLKGLRRAGRAVPGKSIAGSRRSLVSSL
ncbi:MAG: hypothetical protein QXF01_00470 [Candidatus Micrarchaeaceae archaeon]